MTYRDVIVENWLASGVDPDLLRLNPEAIDREVEKELRLWINNFINSFRPENRLKTIAAILILSWLRNSVGTG